MTEWRLGWSIILVALTNDLSIALPPKLASLHCDFSMQLSSFNITTEECLNFFLTQTHG